MRFISVPDRGWCHRVPPCAHESRHGVVPSTGSGRRIHRLADASGRCQRIFVDGTAGGGGHAVALARRLGPEGRLIGLDRDPEMLALAESTVQSSGVSVAANWVHAAYQTMRQVLDDLGIDRVQGVVLDLGLSSDQLAREDRGFSFSADGPLDMRFDQSEPGPTAAELVNRMREEDLAKLFFELGEERFSRRVARRIVEERTRWPIAPPASWPAWCGGRPRPGTAQLDRPGDPRLSGLEDRGQ